MRPTAGENRSARRTRALIEKAFIELMEQKPIRKVTVQELIDRADVCRTTFYAHYQDIPDLVDSIEQALLQKVRTALEQLDQAPIRVDGEYPTIQAVVELYARHGDLFLLLNGEHGDPKFDERFQDTIYDVTRKLRMAKEGADFDEARHKLYSCYVISGGISVLNRLLSEHLPLNVQDASSILGAMAAAGEQVFLGLQQHE